MKKHNIAIFTCDMRAGFNLIVTMDTGKVITLSGESAVNTFLEMVPVIAGETIN